MSAVAVPSQWACPASWPAPLHGGGPCPGLRWPCVGPFSQEDLHQRLEHYRRTYRSLGSAATAEQSDVDAVFGMAGVDHPLPKGCAAETMERVQSILREAAGDLSALEVGEMLGLSRVSARRYLEYLREVGQAQVNLRYGGGRPERRYSRRGA